MSKNVTLFIASLASGGAEHQMCILADMLVERGYDVTLVTFADASDHYSYSSKIKRVRLALEKSIWQKVIAICVFFLILKTDCVISYTQRSNFLCLLPLLLRPKIKVIASERNTTIGKPNKIERLLFALLYKRANYIIPNSHTQGDYICLRNPSLASKVVPIINYTDIDTFSPSPLLLEDVFKIAVFARFEKQKNCLLFAEVLSILKKGKQRRFVVHWYGNHHFTNTTLSEYYECVQQRIFELGIDDVLFIHDPVKDVAKVLPQYDAVCLPSIYEGFSNSVAEGIASGRPMIVSDVSDNSLMVHQGENGFLFNPMSTEDMVNSFKQLFALSDAKLREMGKRSREIAEYLFNRDNFIEAYVQLIEN